MSFDGVHVRVEMFPHGEAILECGGSQRRFPFDAAFLTGQKGESEIM
jgi:hypothetical protein